VISSLSFFHDSANRQLLADIRPGVSHMAMAAMSAAVHKDPEFMALLRILNFGLIDTHQRLLIGGVVRNLGDIG
jgi:hypothetical protein